MPSFFSLSEIEFIGIKHFVAYLAAWGLSYICIPKPIGVECNFFGVRGGYSTSVDTCVCACVCVCVCVCVRICVCVCVYVLSYAWHAQLEEEILEIVLL